MRGRQLEASVALAIAGGILWVILSPPITGTSRDSSVVVLFLMVIPRISDAIERTRIEREQVTAERTAFQRFIKRVSKVEPNESPVEADATFLSSEGSRKRAAVVEKPIEDTSTLDSTSASIAMVRTSYEETVMTVPHYQDIYNESLVKNLTAEFGQGIAWSLTEGDVLTPQLQRAILIQARQAREERTNLLNQAEAEYESLTGARRQLRELHKTTTAIEKDLDLYPFQKLVESWERLEMAEKKCETVLYERQTHIQTGGTSVPAWSLQQYLYQPFQWRYPVINDVLEMITHIQNIKHKILKKMYSW